MSVTLQQRIGLDRQRLRMYIENLPRLAPVIDEQLPLVETQANLQVLLLRQQEERNRIRDGVNGLQKHDEQWQAIIDGLEGESRAAEQALYDVMLANPENLVSTIEDGQGVLEILQQNISETEALVQQVEGLIAMTKTARRKVRQATPELGLAASAPPRQPEPDGPQPVALIHDRSVDQQQVRPDLGHAGAVVLPQPVPAVQTPPMMAPTIPTIPPMTPTALTVPTIPPTIPTTLPIPPTTPPTIPPMTPTALTDPTIAPTIPPTIPLMTPTALTDPTIAPTIPPTIPTAPTSPVDLPKMGFLLKFDGDPRKFFPWYDVFVTVIDSQPIPPVQKFRYLLSSLTGSALAAIEGVAVMKENYPEAMEVLKRLFGDANKVKMSLYSQLDLLPVAPDRTEELRNTLESVDCICRQLRSLGENVDQPAFVMVIEKKFPQAIILKLQKQKAPDERWKPTNFRRELEALIYGREQAERTCAPQGYGNQASSQQCQPFHEKVRSWQEECWLSQNDETKHPMSDASAASDASEAAKSAVQRFPTKQPP